MPSDNEHSNQSAARRLQTSPLQATAGHGPRVERHRVSGRHQPTIACQHQAASLELSRNRTLPTRRRTVNKTTGGRQYTHAPFAAAAARACPQIASKPHAVVPQLRHGDCPRHAQATTTSRVHRTSREEQVLISSPRGCGRLRQRHRNEMRHHWIDSAQQPQR